MAFRACAVPGCPRPQRKREWCNTHYQRWRKNGDPTEPAPRPTELDRFWAKVDRSGDCWLWTGARGGGGYPVFMVRREGRQVLRMSHRYAYELLVGPIPDGLQLDHLCRVRHCVNPTHLEPVTPRENTLRGDTFQRANLLKTHCKRGHPFDEANTYRIPPSPKLPEGGRDCRACWRERRRLRAARIAD